MRRIILTLLYLTNLLFQAEPIHAESVQAESVQSEPIQAESVQTEPFRWCAFFNWPPWIYKNDQASYSGILIDQLQLFKSNNPDVSLIIKEIDSWKRCQESVALGSTDFILGANKTPEREMKFHYLERPSFINYTEVGVYSAHDSDVPEMPSLTSLRNYSLAFVRGNSYGKEVDDYIKSLSMSDSKARLVPLSTTEQVMQFVALHRADYFFLPKSSYKQDLERIRAMSFKQGEVSFREIYSVKRSTPVFLAFSKKHNVYQQLQGRWLDTLDEYYRTVDFNARVAFHQQQLKQQLD